MRAPKMSSQKPISHSKSSYLRSYKKEMFITKSRSLEDSEQFSFEFLHVQASAFRRCSRHILKIEAFGNISLTNFVRALARESIGLSEVFTSYLKN